MSRRTRRAAHGSASTSLSLRSDRALSDLVATAAAILTRHAPLAALISDFQRTLQHESREIPYPPEEIRRLG